MPALFRLAAISLIFLLSFAALPGPAIAVLPAEQLSDPALETRALEISKQIRCVVCQNQSIDDSSAPLARDMRLLVRERLVAGDSDAEVVDFLVQRYGNFVLLKPPFQLNTLLLWLTPFIVFLLALFVLVSQLHRRGARNPAQPLSAEEEQRLSKILGGADSALTQERGTNS